MKNKCLVKDELVIIKMAENEPIWAGYFLGWIKKNERTNFPLVRSVFDGSDREIISGVIIPYSSEIEIMLNTLTFQKQWELLLKFGATVCL